MKKTLLLLILLTVLSCSDKELSSNEKKGLFGEIKAYEKIFLTKETSENNEIYFDTVQKIEYIFNLGKKVKKSISWIKLGNKIFLRTTTFDLDNKNRILKEVTKSSLINEKNSNTHEWIYSYNENNEISKITSSYKTEKVKSNEIYEYYYKNDNELKKIEYNNVKVLLSINDTIKTKSIELYNKKGLLETTYHIFPNFDEKDTDTITIKQEYNRKNLCSKVINIGTDKEPMVEVFKYEYDDNGSWILQEGYYKDELVGKVIRKIEYN